MGDESRATGIPWLRLGSTVLLVAALVMPGIALAAGGSFVDDENSTFEKDIDWMAGTGVTKGCNPPANDRFCPNQNVTRGQMAAFMHRFADYVAQDLIQAQGCGQGFMPGQGFGPGQKLSPSWQCVVTLVTPVPGSIAMNGSAEVTNYDNGNADSVMCGFEIGGTWARWSPRTVQLDAPVGPSSEGAICASTTWVEVPAGTHTVTFRVEKQGFSADLWVFDAAANAVFTPARG
jgi:hypothetical protein